MIRRMIKQSFFSAEKFQAKPTVSILDVCTFLFSGVVLGGPFEEPISNITVVLKKKVVALSDNKGKFYLTVPREYEDRLIVTFQDPNDRYFDTTITLPFQRGQIVFHKVTLQLEDPPVEFDSTQELKVPVGHAEENMAELQIPANTLLQRDGTPYKGTYNTNKLITEREVVTGKYQTEALLSLGQYV